MHMGRWYAWGDVVRGCWIRGDSAHGGIDVHVVVVQWGDGVEGSFTPATWVCFR